MTVLDHSPRATYAPRMARRHEIVTTAGIEGVLRIGAFLRSCGFPVRDFTVDVRDGVPYSSVTCTVSLTRSETASFADRMAALDGVVTVEPC